MLPIRRDFRFNLGSRDVLNWHERGPYVTHFFNTYTITIVTIPIFTYWYIKL